MKTIPETTVERHWKKVTEATPEDAQALLDQMAKAQPYIFAYLMAVDETLLDDEERGRILIIGVVLWETLRKNAPPGVIPFEDLEAAEAANLAFLDQLENGSEYEYQDRMQQLVGSYNQMPLLGSIIEALMDGCEEEPELANENLGLALIHLKSVIDCLDR